MQEMHTAVLPARRGMPGPAGTWDWKWWQCHDGVGLVVREEFAKKWAEKGEGEEKGEIKDTKLKVADKGGDKTGEKVESKYRKAWTENVNEGLDWVENQQSFIWRLTKGRLKQKFKGKCVS